MNAKKFLKQHAEAYRKKLLEESNTEIYECYFENSEDTAVNEHWLVRYRKWIIAAACVLIAAIIATMCVLLLYRPKKDPVIYLEQNQVKSNSTIEEMSGDMKEFSFDIDNTLYSVDVEKTSDSLSNDVLCYEVSVNSLDTLVKLNFVAVCNINYVYDNIKLTDNYIATELHDYSVLYKQEPDVDTKLGLPLLEGSAELKKGSEVIYITMYSEYILDDGNGSFLETIEKMFI